MTLIAIALKGNYAELLTDTSLYTRHVQTLGRSSKQVTIPTLGAAVLTQGDIAFGTAAKVIALRLAADIGTFDGLVDELPDSLRAQAEQMRETGDLTADATLTVFLVGPSNLHSCYVAYAFPGEHDFEPTRLDDVFTIPTPFDARPHAFEADRVRTEETANDAVRLAQGLPVPHPVGKLVDNWLNKPATPTPRGKNDWIALAQRIRHHRSLGNAWSKVIVCGDLHYTRLGRTRVETNVVHTFNDTGDELLELVAGTWHRLAQAAACWCDSGKRFIDCHLAPHLDDECCGGRAFRDCCAIGVNEPALAG